MSHNALPQSILGCILYTALPCIMYTAQWHEKDPGGATLAEQYESDTQTVEVLL